MYPPKAPAFVAPFVGAWIEMAVPADILYFLPPVAPFVGAWIEMMSKNDKMLDEIVAPFVGAWIEISHFPLQLYSTWTSLPSWERGLKYVDLSLFYP